MPEYQPDRHEKNLATLAHLLSFIGFIVPGMNIVIPLIIWIMKRKQSPYIDHHAREELNFQITLTLVYCIWIALKIMLVGFLLLPLIPIIIIMVFIFVVRAAMKASQGIYYIYPFSLRLIK